MKYNTLRIIRQLPREGELWRTEGGEEDGGRKSPCTAGEGQSRDYNELGIYRHKDGNRTLEAAQLLWAFCRHGWRQEIWLRLTAPTTSSFPA